MGLKKNIVNQILGGHAPVAPPSGSATAKAIPFFPIKRHRDKYYRGIADVESVPAIIYSYKLVQERSEWVQLSCIRRIEFGRQLMHVKRSHIITDHLIGNRKVKF